jgi:type IV pilus assembly protein PilB
MHLLTEDIRSILTDSSLVSEEEITASEKESSRSGRTVFDVLIGKGILSERFLAESLSSFYHTPFIDLERIEIESSALEEVPEEYAKAHGVVLFALDKEKKIGKLAVLDPEDFTVWNYLCAKLDIWLDVFITTPSGIKFGLKHYKKRVNEEFSLIIEENLHSSLSDGTLDVSKMVESIPIVTMLDAIIEHAVTLGSSDIHFEPFEEKFAVRYRVDGIMQEILSMPPAIAPIIVARIKVLANLQIDVHSSPQDGRFRVDLEDEHVDVRVSVLPTFHGEKAEMRVLKGSLRPLGLSELGFSNRDLLFLEDAIKRPHGMILVTGPTGSGKSTTLYSILGILNQSSVNISTIEDPVEYDIPGVNQSPVHIKGGFTFATGLRALMRQNPDIIMVGEIRDGETADIAVNAALTGHLLLSTLHTNDAVTAIPRLIDLSVEPFLVASTLNIVIAQRLVRKICSVCVEGTKPSEEMITLMRKQKEDMDAEVSLPQMVFHGKGCKTCEFSGYRGQIGLFEAFPVTDDIRAVVSKSTSSEEIKKIARKNGMRFMFEDGLEKVEAGLTTIEEVLRVTRE